MLSSEAGFISSSYDIASSFALLFVSFVGGLGNKPKWLGAGIVIMGLGGVVFSVPHFRAATYQVAAVQDLCVLNSSNYAGCSDLTLRSNR